MSCYDFEFNYWFSVVSLFGIGFEGFGIVVVVVDGKLYVMMMNGWLYCYVVEWDCWMEVIELSGIWFFYCMLFVDEWYLLLIGGVDMRVGKFDDFEWVDLVGDK